MRPERKYSKILLNRQIYQEAQAVAALGLDLWNMPGRPLRQLRLVCPYPQP